MRNVSFNIKKIDNPTHIGYDVYLQIRHGDGYCANIPITELFNLLINNDSFLTAREVEMNQGRIRFLLDTVYEQYLRAIGIKGTKNELIFFESFFMKALSMYRYNNIGTVNIKQEKKPEVPEVPEDIKEALDITSLAIKRQKQIKEFEKEIIDKKNSFYKKYGTFTEKCLAYLSI